MFIPVVKIYARTASHAWWSSNLETSMQSIISTQRFWQALTAKPRTCASGGTSEVSVAGHHEFCVEKPEEKKKFMLAAWFKKVPNVTDWVFGLVWKGSIAEPAHYGNHMLIWPSSVRFRPLASELAARSMSNGGARKIPGIQLYQNTVFSQLV